MSQSPHFEGSPSSMDDMGATLFMQQDSAFIPDFQNDSDILEDDRSFQQEDGNGEGIEADSEIEDQKMNDVIRENTAISAYHDTHPENEQRQLGGREISEQEAIWSVSSFRPHWGPDKLRDNNPLTYWQSDNPNPRLEHTIDLSFHQATLIRQVSFFIDCEQDESYAPKIVSIRVGTNTRDLHELKEIETEPIVGWVNADITESNDGNPLRVFRLQIAILATHQNGRDTHIRQVKVYSVLPSFNKEKEEPIQRSHIRKIKGIR